MTWKAISNKKLTFQLGQMGFERLGNHAFEKHLKPKLGPLGFEGLGNHVFEKHLESKVGHVGFFWNLKTIRLKSM